MNIHNKKHLNLLFPQWQGSGPSNVLYHGAKRLQAFFSDIDFRTINVPETRTLETFNNILGYSDIVSQLEEAVSLVKNFKPESIFTLGGDCAVELAPVSYLNHYYNNDLALLWFDAHGDLNTPESSLSRHFHGMPLRTLLGEGDPQITDRCLSLIKPDQVIMAGIRELDEPEQAFLDTTPIDILKVKELESDPACLVNKIKDKGFRRVYIHIDLDVLDPEAYQNTKHPTADGLFPETLCRIISLLNDEFNVAGCSILEFIQIKDQGLNQIQKFLSPFL
ncbi:MAG: arginase family protein [Desulfobacteraceae bacterium]|nr:arginase family protein [Desulfobacteraceae bacterium]